MEMRDPKLAGQVIMRKTQCWAGSHMFIYPGGGTPAGTFSLRLLSNAAAAVNMKVLENLRVLPAPDSHCDCGLYTWAEWSVVAIPHEDSKAEKTA